MLVGEKGGSRVDWVCCLSREPRGLLYRNAMSNKEEKKRKVEKSGREWPSEGRYFDKDQKRKW